MPTDFVTYESTRAPDEIIAMVWAAAPDDEMGVYRLFGGSAKYVSRAQPSGFSVYRARIVNRMPATLVASIEPKAEGGSTVSTWFEPKPTWREAALDIALWLALVLVCAAGLPAYAVPATIALAGALVGVSILFRRAWERDRRATREFITSLLEE